MTARSPHPTHGAKAKPEASPAVPATAINRRIKCPRFEPT
jgi:hypothetical protein